MKNISLFLLLFLVFSCSSPSAQEKNTVETKTVVPVIQKTPAPAKTVHAKELPTANTSTSKASAKINWMTLEEAQAANKRNPKKIFIDMYTSWCGPCKMLDRNTFSNDEVAKYVNDNFYAVKFNAESPKEVSFNGKTYSNPNYNPQKTRGRNAPHQFTQTIGIRGYPTIVILNSDLKVASKIVGYKAPQQLMQSLNTL